MAVYKFKDAKCRKCGKRGHTGAICRQITQAIGSVEQREFADPADRVALTVWSEDGAVNGRVWIVDSSTQHVMADRPDPIHQLQEACA